MDAVHAKEEEPDAEEPAKATTSCVVPAGMWCSYAALGLFDANHCIT